MQQRDKKYDIRVGFIMDTADDLLCVMEDKRINQTELAHSLNKSKGYVSKLLNGDRNMTLGTLSDVCFSLGVEPRVRFTNIETGECTNPSNSEKQWVELSIAINALSWKTPRLDREEVDNNILRFPNHGGYRDRDAA